MNHTEPSWSAPPEKPLVVMAVLACGFSMLLWLTLWFANPYVEGAWRNQITAPGILMFLLCIIGSVAALKREPVAMLLLSLFNLVPVGGYLLGTPGIFRWIGLLNLVYLVSAGGMLVLRSLEQSRR